jgi:hypothetical protein
MILRKKEIVEKRQNGKIKYIETRAVISPMWIARYPNHRQAPDGTLWIRVGVNKKFRSNGKLEWEIKYNDCGNVVQ